VKKFFRRITYAFLFLSLAWKKRREYDAVFVHMNQEYILIAGLLWKVLGKPVYLWRNHYAGSFLTRIAGALSRKVFCTSRYSYTARFAKTVIMPVGSDTDYLSDMPNVERVSRSILVSGRVSASKNIHQIVEALGMIAAEGAAFTADIYGSTTPEEAAYREGLITRIKDLGLADRILVHEAVPSTETKYLYASHEFAVNASPSGMLDKTMFSAMGRRCILISCNKDLKPDVPAELHFEEGSVMDLARSLRAALALTDDKKEEYRERMERLVFGTHSLSALADKLVNEMTS
jgi:glycosyltransferase involved in cell wall biosynthesis